MPKLQCHHAEVHASPAGGPWVRVIVVNYNGGTLIQSCLDALAGQNFADFEAVVVDNASTDGSADRLKLPDDRFRLVRVGCNLGFAAGCNHGAEGAMTPWLAMLNPDAIAEPAWLERLYDAAMRHGEAGLFGSTQIMADTPDLLDGCGDVYSVYGFAWRGGHGWSVNARPDTDCFVFSPCAAAALYRRDLFVSLNGFDEDFFCYFEDVDFGFRALLAGHCCIQVHDATVYHYGSVSTGQTSDFTIFHSYRNMVWVLLKNAPSPLVFAMLPLFLLALTYLYVRTRNLQPWHMRWRGVWAARMGIRRIWRKRREIQRRRTVSTILIAKSLVWRPRALRRRDIFCLKRTAAPSASGRKSLR